MAAVEEALLHRTPKAVSQIARDIERDSRTVLRALGRLMSYGRVRRVEADHPYNWGYIRCA